MGKKINHILYPKDSVHEAQMMAKWDGLVRRLAARYHFLGDFDDVAQDGRMGLLYAIRYYDESKGVPFQKLAQLCIRSFMLNEYKKKGKMVRGGKEIGDTTTLCSDMADYDCVDEDSIVYKYDYLLTDDEIDAMVLSRKEYQQQPRSVGYMVARRNVMKKIADKENIDVKITF